MRDLPQLVIWLSRRYLPGGGGKMPDPDGLDDKSLALADHIWLHGCEVDASCIDIFFGLLRKASVLKIGKLRFVGIAPLRAALALVFLILTIVQPGLFASANAANLQVGAVIAQGFEAGDHKAEGRKNGHHAAAESKDGNSHHGGKMASDKGCEVHCAPANAVPVGCQGIASAVAQCFVPAIAAILLDGEYADLIRPPRT